MVPEELSFLIYETQRTTTTTSPMVLTSWVLKQLKCNNIKDLEFIATCVVLCYVLTIIILKNLIKNYKESMKRKLRSCFALFLWACSKHFKHFWEEPHNMVQRFHLGLTLYHTTQLKNQNKNWDQVPQSPDWLLFWVQLWIKNYIDYPRTGSDAHR